jgi:hypothetical protein
VEEIMKTATAHDIGMAEVRTTKSFTRHLPRISQILMGLPLVVFGLNGFFNFIPPPATPLQRKPLLLQGHW